MTILTQKKQTGFQSVCVFGAPKTGKSYLVGKLAEKYNLIWFDSEQGYDVLRQLPEEWQSRIDIIALPDSRIHPIAALTWLQVVSSKKGFICTEHGGFNCPTCKAKDAEVSHFDLTNLGQDTIVVFDSLTQLTNSFISQMNKGKPDDYKMEFDDWGYLKILMDKFLSQIQTASYNRVCITHEEEVRFEDKSAKLVPSAGSANSSRNTAKYFGHVVYAKLSNGKHTFGSSTTFASSVVTGSRLGIAVEKMSVPSLIDIFEGKIVVGGTGTGQIDAKAKSASILAAMKR